MGVLDERRLAVALSPFEACEGLRRWPITGEAGPVGVVQRVGWGPGRVISGLRHRLPQEVVELDGSVSVRVGRSRQVRGRATGHAVHRPDHALLGRVRTTAGPVHDLEDAEGVVVARLTPTTDDDGHWRVGGPDPVRAAAAVGDAPRGGLDDPTGVGAHRVRRPHRSAPPAHRGGGARDRPVVGGRGGGDGPPGLTPSP